MFEDYSKNIDLVIDDQIFKNISCLKRMFHQK